MTIDEAIKHGKEQLHIFGKCDHADFIKCSIDTMRKYQKIKEIVSNNELEWGNTSVRANALCEVKKEVEDGSN